VTFIQHAFFVKDFLGNADHMVALDMRES